MLYKIVKKGIPWLVSLIFDQTGNDMYKQILTKRKIKKVLEDDYSYIINIFDYKYNNKEIKEIVNFLFDVAFSDKNFYAYSEITDMQANKLLEKYMLYMKRELPYLRVSNIDKENIIECMNFHNNKLNATLLDIKDILRLSIIENSLSDNKQKYKEYEDNKEEFYYTAKKDAEKKKVINNLPFFRNQYFTGRDDIIDRLHYKFKEMNHSYIQCIIGIPGSGKTQIVSEYAYRYHQEYDVIWWIMSNDKHKILEGYINFAKEMDICPNNLDDLIYINIVKSWMETNDNWLFIFDNVESYEDIYEFLPKIFKGDILISSRYNINGSFNPQKIDLFTPLDSVLFLKKRTEIEDDTDIEKLAYQLGYLPLALEQAAAYIISSGESFSDYLKLFKDYGVKLFGDSSNKEEYKYTVNTTWKISMDKIKNYKVHSILFIIAYFDADEIPLFLIYDNRKILEEILDINISDKIEYNNLIEQLSTYSLIKVKSKKIYIHRLFQEVLRKNLSEYKIDKYIKCCVRIVDNILKFDFGVSKDRHLFIEYLSHVTSVVNCAEKILKSDEYINYIASINYRLGFGLESVSYYLPAKKCFLKSLYCYRKLYGYYNIYTANSYEGIALIYKVLGNFDWAKRIFFKALEIRLKVSDSLLETATTYNNIARVLHDQGEFDEALRYYHLVLKMRKDILGMNHKDIASVYNNIALVYRNLGNLSMAIECHKKDLNILTKLNELNSVDAISTYNNFAKSYDMLKRYDDALDYYNKALKIAISILGENHPHTAIIYDNLGVIYKNMNKLENADSYFNKAIDIRLNIFGANHYFTAQSYNNYGELLCMQKKYNEAKKYFLDARRIFNRFYGQKHPYTIRVNNNLSNLEKNMKIR